MQCTFRRPTKSAVGLPILIHAKVRVWDIAVLQNEHVGWQVLPKAGGKLSSD